MLVAVAVVLGEDSLAFSPSIPPSIEVGIAGSLPENVQRA